MTVRSVCSGSYARRWACTLGTVAILTTSCSLFVDLSDLTGGPLPADAGGDPSATSELDATGRRDGAPDADVDAPVEAGIRKNACGALLFGAPVPVFNGDVELGCASGLTAYQANVTEETKAPSSGSIACKVCYVGGANGYILSASVKRDIVVGESYEVVACVRAVPGEDSGVAVYAEVGTGNAGKKGNNTATTDTYVPVRVGWDVTQAGQALTVSVRGFSVPGACFLVDDISLSIVRDAGVP